VQAPRLNPSLRNGALVLGLNGIMIKSHGHADALGIATAIAAARKVCVSASDKITEGRHARETEAV
jgi:glycerol-3-phosphate acyltransferase PlsX